MLKSLRGVALMTGLVAGVLVAGTAVAQMARESQTRDTLSLLTVLNEGLYVHRDGQDVGSARSFAPAAVDRWDAAAAKLPGSWTAQVDKRTGAIEFAEGSGVAFVPGRGNSLRNADLGLAPDAQPTLAHLEQAARGFLPQVAGALGLKGETLVLNQGRSGNPDAHIWFVDFDIVRDGIAIDNARVVFRVNNGNLIQFGTENLPAPGTATPSFKLSQRDALGTLERYVGGFWPGEQWVDGGSRHLLPIDRDDAGKADGYVIGNGRGLVAVWQFTFRRPDTVGTWRARVDAASGEVIEFKDVNDYASAKITGGAYTQDYPAASRNANERLVAMPFANYGTSLYANSGGVYNNTGAATSTLNGKYVKITDSCGAISKASDAAGNIALGTGTGTDCTIPSGGGGAGNTHSARTQFYNLNRIKEVGRGWLPSNTWLQGVLTANVNLNQTCNAYWNGSTVNFFRSGGGCSNTGELPGVSLHEWGHGLDSNDGNGSSTENGTGETYGDFTAALITHNSCTGNGFLSSNCGGYGNACTSCSGVRDIDWAKHSRNTPSTAGNFSQSCPASSSGYVGPCGKEGHCESLVSSEALWDLANRDLPNPGTGSAWAITDRLWYLSRSTSTSAFTCVKTTSPYTSNGCGAGSLWKTMRAIDDDNGNLSDGTPHGGALYAAFNRHGLACTTDAAASTTFAGCTPPAAPSLTLAGGDSSASASWSGSTGVYDVYRNETSCNAGFTKVANDTASTSFLDSSVANGTTYYYQVVAQPSGNEACASAPSTCMSVTPAGVACTPPAAPTGLTASGATETGTSLSWTAVSGATGYNVYRGTVSGGPYTQVGTSSTTSFTDSGLTCNTGYFYVVRAATTCESGNSNQATSTTTACNNVLTNGVAKTGIAGALQSQNVYTMVVPAGASGLKFVTTGGTGDADLYAKLGSAPTTTVNDCKSEGTTAAETCTPTASTAGTWYVMIYGYSAYSGVSLTGSYTTTVNTPPTANFTFTTSALVATFTNTSTDAGGSVVGSAWTFGDATTSTTTSPSHTYAAAGTYTVGLTVTDNGGLTGSTSKSVTVSNTTTCTAVNDTEPNNSKTTPQTITGACNQISGTFLNDTSTGKDDYYKLTLPAGKTVTALLNGLTVDYDLYIYKSGTTAAVASGLASGTTAENISYTNSTTAAITIYVRAYRYSSTRTTYQLKVSYP